MTSYDEVTFNEGKEIVGVFSWESFGKRMSELHEVKPDLATLAAKDTDLAKAQFIDPDLYIDTETDRGCARPVE